MGSAAVSMVGGYRGQTVTVEAVTLQDIVGRNHLKRLAFVKMDIEGSEEKTIASSAPVFRTYRPRIIIESQIAGEVRVRVQNHSSNQRRLAAGDGRTQSQLSTS